MAIIAREHMSVAELTWRYIVPFSLLAPVASMIGMTFFDSRWNADLGYLVPRADILAAGATTLAVSIATVYALAGVFLLLAPMYGSPRDFRATLRLATFGSLPVLAAGGLLILPVMAILGLAGLGFSLYLLWLGARDILRVKPGEQAEFIGIAIVLLFVISSLTGAIVGGILGR